MDNIIDGSRQIIRGLGDRVWLLLVGLIVGGLFLWGFQPVNSAEEVNTIEGTVQSAIQQTNQYVPTIIAAFTLTPDEAILTSAAPTLQVLGRQQIEQFAAAASATSEVNDLDWGAVQAAGPPNSETCAELRSAWGTKTTLDVSTLTLYYPEIVVPTGLIIYQPYNPGYVREVIITDIFGEDHLVYTGPLQPAPFCPFTLVILVENADYAANIVRVVVDQSSNPGGRSLIDAVEMIGFEY